MTPGPAGNMAIEQTGGDRAAEADLRDLMLGYQRGEEPAVEVLFRSLSPLLWRYFLSSCVSRSDAEDLLQDCWMRIHRSRHTYSPEQPLLPWVFAIARHTRLDSYRSRRRRESRETLVASPPEMPAQAGTDRPELDRLSGLLAQLPEGQREVLVMLKVTGMSLEEVARATSSTVGAIKQKAHRAYARLREILEKGAR